MHHFRNTYPTNTNAVSGYLIPDDEDNNTLPLAEINIAALQLTAPTNLSTVSIPYSYRYGFNGQEHANELNSSSYDFGARMYDARIGRWFKPDPLEKIYPNISTYVFSLNSCIYFNDIDGRLVTGYSQLYSLDPNLSVLNYSKTWKALYKSFSDVNGSNFNIDLRFHSQTLSKPDFTGTFGTASISLFYKNDPIDINNFDFSQVEHINDITFQIDVRVCDRYINMIDRKYFGAFVLIHEVGQHVMDFANLIYLYNNGHITANELASEINCFNEDENTNDMLSQNHIEMIKSGSLVNTITDEILNTAKYLHVKNGMKDNDLTQNEYAQKFDSKRHRHQIAYRNTYNDFVNSYNEIMGGYIDEFNNSSKPHRAPHNTSDGRKIIDLKDLIFDEH